ncbi:MAG: SCO family protein [Rhizomicrobium sp.]
MSIPCYLASMIFQRFVALCLLALLAACGRSGTNWHATDITGALPALDFSLKRASDGTPAQASDYRGKIVVLYFGYTHCPDICPATLANLADAIQKLGSRANEVRVLFVTVDPNRDTGPILAGYVRSFAPEIEGLRGSDDQLTDVARRYRVVYSVTPDSRGHPYEVMHSAAAFFFDRNGRARLVATKTDDVARLTADLKQLLDM